MPTIAFKMLFYKWQTPKLENNELQCRRYNENCRWDCLVFKGQIPCGHNLIDVLLAAKGGAVNLLNIAVDIPSKSDKIPSRCSLTEIADIVDECISSETAEKQNSP